MREASEIVELWGALEVARNRAAWAVRETAQPPTFYLPLADIRAGLLERADNGAFCKWKGSARYWNLVHGTRRLDEVAWSYPHPLSGAGPLARCVAFYAHNLDCCVGGSSASHRRALSIGAGSAPIWPDPSEADR